MTSVVPPAENGTMMRTGWSGQRCAIAAGTSMAAVTMPRAIEKMRGDIAARITTCDAQEHNQRGRSIHWQRD
jgi:hypothetical protein